MAYEIYKEIKTQKDFYNGWDKEQVSNLDENMKKYIYDKYVIKALTLQRDNFTCQNKNCLYCNNIKETSNLTRHHIKFQKNNGKDTLRNSISLCKEAHKRYHAGKCSLTFNGMTYKIHKETTVNKKENKLKNKKIRKYNKKECGIRISWNMVKLLMKFLEINIKDYEEDDD